MASPGLTFADSIQDVRRLPLGIAYGDTLDEIIRVINFLKVPGAGESMTVSRVLPVNDLAALSSFKAVGATPTGGTPAATALSFTFRRVNSIGGDDISLAVANMQPNELRAEDRAMRFVSILRLIAIKLMTGDNTDANGPLGWENFTNAVTRTDFAFIGVTPANVLETVSSIDDNCSSGPLGHRASAFVTTPRGRRNIEIAAATLGVTLKNKLVPKLPTAVPHYRGKPILISSGLVDNSVTNRAPIYAVDLDYVFLMASTGEPENYCIESREMPLQADGTVGVLQWFHGACIVRHPRALVRSEVTTTLSS